MKSCGLWKIVITALVLVVINSSVGWGKMAYRFARHSLHGMDFGAGAAFIDTKLVHHRSSGSIRRTCVMIKLQDVTVETVERLEAEKVDAMLILVPPDLAHAEQSNDERAMWEVRPCCE